MSRPIFRQLDEAERELRQTLLLAVIRFRFDGSHQALIDARECCEAAWEKFLEAVTDLDIEMSKDDYFHDPQAR